VLLEVEGYDAVDLGGEWKSRRLKEGIEGFGEVLGRPASRITGQVRSHGSLHRQVGEGLALTRMKSS
jgi:hypothetical protein